MPDEAFAAILGRPVPRERTAIGADMCIRDLNHGRSPLFWLLWAALHSAAEKSAKKGRPDLNVLFLYNMPLHAISKNAGGMVSREMVDALVIEIWGFWILGLLRCLCAFAVNMAKNRALAKKLDEDAARGGRAPAGGDAPGSDAWAMG